MAEATALTIDISSLVIGDTVSVTSAGGPIIKAAISVARDTIQAIDAGYLVTDNIAPTMIDGATISATNSSGSVTGPLTQQLWQLSH